MRLYPSHEKCGCDKQEYADRKHYSDCQEFHGAITGLSVFYQSEEAGYHTEDNQQQHDGDDCFYHDTTLVRKKKRPIITEVEGKQP